MKTLMAMAVTALSLTAVGTDSAQCGTMMNGSGGGMGDDGWMGGYGGFWSLSSSDLSSGSSCKSASERLHAKSTTAPLEQGD